MNNTVSFVKDKEREKKDKKEKKDKDKKDKLKDKEKDKADKHHHLKILHKKSLKKWLVKSKSKQMFDTYNIKDISSADTKSAGVGGQGTGQSYRSSVSLAANATNDDDDSDDEDDDDDIDYAKIDESIKKEEIQAMTSKDVTNMIVQRLKMSYSEPFKFTTLSEALEVAQEDHTHLIFMVYCVDWFDLARNTANNFKQLSKEKDVTVFFIDQSSPDYARETNSEIAGVPSIKIFYRQQPIRIKRSDLDHEWTDEERLNGYPSPSNIQQLLIECRSCKQNYDQQVSIDPSMVLEINVGF
ncbi:hypothetical protein SAMD00019534_088430 [Acytostelium subglobosum LB1]|uniref:hypothetical protein n=1 Tax=Acytostelium subglobosum LB1 TaxID=1410327 RepID=UPI0006449776|nr:hypothetical protein SAMD00019534_088430 [Acytostelium subglobosum LB1]GAM25668.1 hypothetical protein SAMD00019534_088430 [Acytostelium subglobosum LB1]|eukprot:XP_012751186.1 hypothetical protein SAMD00019534_088430 [Acytostelium subglobosum LB1]